jgi:hypothetical protein
MTTSVKDAGAAAATAKRDVDDAEAELASGSQSVTASALHKLRDAWRHADLTAKGAQTRAEQDRAADRLKGLEMIGAEVDKVAASDTAAALEGALRDVAAACTQVRELAGTHDKSVSELVAAATDLQAEPPAPGGPRATSARIAVRKDRANGDSVLHGRTLVSPVGTKIQAAIAYVVEGDADRAVAHARPATELPDPDRPRYLLRDVRSRNVIAMTSEPDAAMYSRIRSGDVELLSGYDIDRYMEGEIG